MFVGYREGGQKVRAAKVTSHNYSKKANYNKLTLSSSVQKHKGIYKLKVLYQAPSDKVWKDEEIDAPFHKWFSDDGYLQKAHLHHWLASSIEMIGIADPEAKSGVREKTVENEVTVDDGVDVDQGAGMETSPRKSGRKGKRKA